MIALSQCAYFLAVQIHAFHQLGGPLHIYRQCLAPTIQFFLGLQVSREHLAGKRAKELAQKRPYGSVRACRARLIARLSVNGQAQPHAGKSAADYLLPVRAGHGMLEPIECIG